MLYLRRRRCNSNHWVLGCTASEILWATVTKSSIFLKRLEHYISCPCSRQAELLTVRPCNTVSIVHAQKESEADVGRVDACFESKLPIVHHACTGVTATA